MLRIPSPTKSMRKHENKQSQVNYYNCLLAMMVVK